MPEPRYETRDASTRGVWLFIAGLAMVVGLVCAGVFLLQRWLSSHPSSPVQASHSTGPSLTPPGPALQSAPREDLIAYRQRQQALLESTGWNDPAKTSLHIPISHAMDLIAQRGINGGKAATPLEMQQQKATTPRTP
ncbi:hypothetical protein [Prosthecobacter sp.]|uniref:hypothetical protein n=1 Tax=Prosthecobacter sp. TaxID=1965333 RepID=UPI0037844929